VTEEDERWLADMEKELSYTHWSPEARDALKLALKWWYQSHGWPVPQEYA